MTIDGTNNSENLTGTAGDDTIRGFYGNDTLSGLGGNDRLEGGRNDDTFYGGAGNDVFVFEYYLENDVVRDFVQGQDKIDVRNLNLNDWATLQLLISNDGQDNALITTYFGGSQSQLKLNGINPTQLQATDFIFNTVNLAQTVDGTNNGDQLFGGLGNDTLRGFYGNDVLFGEQGDDQLIGSFGNDTLYGGTENDTAVYTGTRSQYSWINNGGVFTVTDSVANRDSVDTLYGIQKLQFSDQTVTIPVVDDTPPSLSINDITITEGDSGTKNATFTVTRSGTATQPITVNYTTANSTATAGSDYTATSGTLTLATNQTTKTITVPILGDTTVEQDETFSVNLSNVTNATITDNQGQGTITNDDTVPPPTLAINDISITEGNSGTKNATFTVTHTGTATQSITVNYATANGTATAGSDYTATNGTLTFATNETTKTITVPILGDVTIEQDETFFVNLTNPTNATITDNQGKGTITNDDTAPISVTLSVDYGGISEDSPTNFTYIFTRTGVLTNPLTANFTVGGTATAGTDYNSIGNNITFAANSSTAQLVVNPTGDTTVEPDETIALTLTSSTSYDINPTGAVTATIINDDGTRRQKGTAINDVILGTTRGDIITGGLGSDLLTGGSNGDLFTFKTPNEGIDRITDFTPSEDAIVLSTKFGGGLASGETLTPQQFVRGASATSASHRIIYNPSTGGLSFDKDGTGSTAPIQFATLGTNLALTYEDIFVG